jgi:hypothetical protein
LGGAGRVAGTGARGAGFTVWAKTALVAATNNAMRATSHLM